MRGNGMYLSVLAPLKSLYLLIPLNKLVINRQMSVLKASSTAVYIVSNLLDDIWRIWDHYNFIWWVGAFSYEHIRL